MQAATTTTRLASVTTTGGMGNPVVALLEAVGAALLSVIAIVLPLLGLACALIIVFSAVWILRRVLANEGDIRG